MPKIVISAEHLTKKYDLGVISSGTLARDVERWWARTRHQPDPYTRIGQKDAFASVGESILALDDVSFTVEQGETLGIIGKNGAGKSTLLKILSRVTSPTSGVVKVKGRIGSLLEVGTGFHPELTGRENVYLNGAILGMKKAEVTRKFDEIVAFSGVEKFIDTPVKRYSSGMHVRLGFAVAAHLDPEILIVDEVLAVGDAEFQKKCLGKMGEVAGEGRTVLFVSHNMTAINNLCRRTIIIKSGLINFSGNTEQAIKVYQESIINLSSKDITERKDWVGDGSVKITKVSFFNEYDEQIELVKSGQSLRIKLDYVSTADWKNIDFSIGFRTNIGEPLFLCSTVHAKKEFHVSKGTGQISCVIPSLPLTTGTYVLNFSIAKGNHPIIWIPQARSIDVQTIDYFGTGSDLSVGHSPFLVTSNWY